MTLNLLFLTISITIRRMTAEQADQQERVDKLYQELKNKMPYF
ncbi:YrzI family small protein [Neobacillus muris]|nr:YrzI family small protein [Neobacillus muris]